MSDLLLLRERLEFWKARYSRTKSNPDYVRCQYHLQEYIRLINSGVVSKETITKIADSYTDFPHEKQKPLLSLNQKNKIMDLFKNKKEVLTSQEILSRMNLCYEYTRKLLRDLEKEGLLTRVSNSSDKRKFGWRKK